MRDVADGRLAKRLFSLRLTGILLVAGHILATALALSAIFVWTLRETVAQAQEQMLRLLAPSVAKLVESNFRGGRMLLDELVAGAEAGRLALLDREATARQFAQHLRYQPSLAWISWSEDDTGRYVGATRAEDGRILLHYSDPAALGGAAEEFHLRDDGSLDRFDRPLPGGYDPRARTWYRAAASTHRAVWTSVSEFFEGLLGITAARAARRPDGSVRGVFTVDFFAADVSSFVDELRVGRNGYVFAAHRDGAILSTILAESDRPLLADLVLRATMDAPATGDATPVRVRLTDGDFLLLLRDLPISFERDWLCGVLFPANEIRDLALARLRTVLLVTALVILSALLIGSWMSARVARMIAGTIRNVRVLAMHGEETAHPPKPSRIAEIRWLQDSLGRLQETIRAKQRSDAERRRAVDLTRAKSEVLAMVTHDLRAPLQSIAGHCSLMTHGNPPMPDHHLRSVQAITRAGDRMNHMLNDMLDLARIEAGRLPLRIETFDPDDAIHECADLMRLPAANRGLALRMQRTGPRFRMTSDPARLRQILVNLLDNAIRYTLQGYIDIEYEADGDDLRLVVRDTGLGMSADQIATLFRPFEPGPHGARRKDSHGLGLAICKQLTTLLHGTIVVNSRESVGSEFIVRLPLRHVSANAPQGIVDNSFEEGAVGGVRE